jgi:hypothetical protein
MADSKTKAEVNAIVPTVIDERKVMTYAAEAVMDTEDGWETAEQKRIRESIDKLTMLESGDGTVDALNSLALKEAESMSDFYGSDIQGWSKVTDSPEILPNSDHNRIKVLKQCYFLYYRNPLARNIIRTYSYLTVGRGMRVNFFGKGADKAAKRWEKIAHANKWERRYRDIITMTYLLGEWFVLRLPLVNDKHWDDSIGRGDRDTLTAEISKLDPKKIVMCSVSPLEVEDVIHSDVNRESIKQYKVTEEPDKMVGSAIKKSSKWPKIFWSDDVTHFSIDNLENGKRGRPILEPVLRQISYYNLFQTDRVMLNSVRARIPIIRKVAGGTPKKAATKAAMEAHKLPHPGTILVCDKTEEWTTVSAPLDGASATRDGRALLLQIAAGVSLPEYLVTGDASNGSYASTLVSSAPLISMINDYRSRFAQQFEDMIEEATGMRPTIEFPEIVQDDLLKVVQANSVLYRDGAMSKATYSARVGLRYEDEKEKRDEERDDMLANMQNPIIPGDALDQDKKLATDPSMPAAPTEPQYKANQTGATPHRKPTNPGTVPPKQAAYEGLTAEAKSQTLIDDDFADAVVAQLDALRDLVRQMVPKKKPLATAEVPVDATAKPDDKPPAC